MIRCYIHTNTHKYGYIHTITKCRIIMIEEASKKNKNEYNRNDSVISVSVIKRDEL